MRKVYKHLTQRETGDVKVGNWNQRYWKQEWAANLSFQVF